MTQPEQRLEEIESRLRSPYTHENTRVHMTADIMYLLAELRKAQDKLGRVEAACDRIINNEDGHKPPGPPHPTREQATAVRIRAAVADATGGERG